MDNDPHFTIHLPKSQTNICFNINSEPGKILNLVSDPGTGKGNKHMVYFTAQFFFSLGSERYLEGAGELPTGGIVCWQ